MLNETLPQVYLVTCLILTSNPKILTSGSVIGEVGEQQSLYNIHYRPSNQNNTKIQYANILSLHTKYNGVHNLYKRYSVTQLKTGLQFPSIHSET